MVKREHFVPGNLIKVTKKMPSGGQAGPAFSGDLGINERLEVLERPRTIGGTNLVRVRRRKTGEEFDAMYAFVTCFCSPAKD